MGCSQSNAASTKPTGGPKGGQRKKPSPPPFPSTPRSQAAAFEKERTATVKCRTEEGVEKADATAAPQTHTLPANALAAELARQYVKQRDAMLQVRETERAAVAQHIVDEKMQKRERVLSGASAAAAAAAAANGHSRNHHHGGGSSSQGLSSPPPTGHRSHPSTSQVVPVQEEFTVFANASAAEAQAARLTPEKAARALALFKSWVMNDVTTINSKIVSNKKNNNNNNTGDGSDGVSDEWNCTVEFTLRGADGASDDALQAAVQALEEEMRKKPPAAAPPRSDKDTEAETQQGKKGSNNKKERNGKASEKKEKSKTDNKKKKNKEPASPSPAGEGTADGVDPDNKDAQQQPQQRESFSGTGVVFITAVFTFHVEKSYDRKLPWQMEICFHFTS